MRVFLTGGSGLVGSHVAEQLIARGHVVRSQARAHSDTSHLKGLGCEIVHGDLADDSERLAVQMSGCDALVHAAALVGVAASRERYHDLNVAGTRSVFLAARRAAVSRAVHVSSVAVYSRLERTITEDRWQERAIDSHAFYAWSKREAEAEAWRHHDRELQVTTVRPSLIYGERDRHVAARLDRLLRLPVLPLPDGGRHVPSLVYAGNVAHGIVQALQTTASAGRAYNLARDSDTPLREYVSRWCEAAGHAQPFIVRVPGVAIESGAFFIDWLSRVTPGIDLPTLRRPARLLRADNPYDSTRARLELGWTELTSVHTAIERTVAWLARRRTNSENRP